MRRIISFFTAFAMVCFFARPVFATDHSSEDSAGYWDWLLSRIASVNGASDNWVTDLVSSNLSPNVCGSSPDGFHHTSSDHARGGSFARNSDGSFGSGMVHLTCDYCGASFDYNADDLHHDYDNYQP